MGELWSADEWFEFLILHLHSIADIKYGPRMNIIIDP